MRPATAFDLPRTVRAVLQGTRSRPRPVWGNRRSRAPNSIAAVSLTSPRPQRETACAATSSAGMSRRREPASAPPAGRQNGPWLDAAAALVPRAGPCGASRLAATLLRCASWRLRPMLPSRRASVGTAGPRGRSPRRRRVLMLGRGGYNSLAVVFLSLPTWSWHLPLLSRPGPCRLPPSPHSGQLSPLLPLSASSVAHTWSPDSPSP